MILSDLCNKCFYCTLVKPMIALSCADTVKLDEGEDFTCECNGTDGNPPANVTWYKDGRSIATGKKHARLVLKNLQEEDSGTYKCVAMSGDNAKNVKSIEVDVKGIINLMLQSSIFYSGIHIFYA